MPRAMNRPLRLLDVIRTLDPASGGPVEGLRQMTRATRALGHVHDVATLDAPGAPWLRDVAGVVHAAGARAGGYGLAPRLVRWLRTHAPAYDLVIVHGLWQWQGLATWLALSGIATPYVVYPHGMLDPWFRRAHPVRHAKKRLYWTLAERRVLRGAAGILYTCEEEARLAPQSFGDPGAAPKVLGYGLAAPGHGDAQEAVAAFLQRWPALADRRVVLYLGRLHPKKGCDLLLDAFARHAAIDPRLHLVFAGPDGAGLQARLEQQAAHLGMSGRVTFTGMLEGPVKWGALRAAEAFALTSHQENFGIAVAEALAASLPVLVSTQVNIWREIAADGAGFAAADDAAGASELLARWLALAPSERLAMRDAATRCFERRFHIAGAAQRLVALVHELHELQRAAPASATELRPRPSQQ